MVYLLTVCCRMYIVWYIDDSECLWVLPCPPWVPLGASGILRCILGARGCLLGALRYSECIWMSPGCLWVSLGVFGWLLAAVVYSWLAKNQKSLGKTPKT